VERTVGPGVVDPADDEGVAVTGDGDPADDGVLELTLGPLHADGRSVDRDVDPGRDRNGLLADTAHDVTYQT